MESTGFFMSASIGVFDLIVFLTFIFSRILVVRGDEKR